MGMLEVTPDMVNLITNGQYATRTANASEFDQLKEMFSVYLTKNTDYLPDRKFTHGLALLIAHYYTSGPKDTAGGGAGTEVPSDTTSGPLTSERVGDVATTYGAITSSSGSSSSSAAWALWLEMSVYGRQFIALMRSFKPYPVVT